MGNCVETSPDQPAWWKIERNAITQLSKGEKGELVIAELEKALQMKQEEKEKNAYSIAESYICLTITCNVYNLGAYKAMSYGDKALPLLDVRDKKMKVCTYIMIAETLAKEKKETQALKYMTECQNFTKSNFGENCPEMLAVYIGYGYVYKLLDDPAKSLEWYKKAEAISDSRVLNQKELAQILTNGVSTFGDPLASIIENNLKAQSLDTGSIDMLLGELCLILDKVDEAISYFEKGLEILSRSETKDNFIHAYTVILDRYRTTYPKAKGKLEVVIKKYAPEWKGKS